MSASRLHRIGFLRQWTEWIGYPNLSCLWTDGTELDFLPYCVCQQSELIGPGAIACLLVDWKTVGEDMLLCSVMRGKEQKYSTNVVWKNCGVEQCQIYESE